MQTRSIDPRISFWAKVDKVGPIPEHRPDLGRCWVWLASKNKGGYGLFDGPTSGLAHRFVVDLLTVIPKGQDIDHLCRNRLCVNPAHLELKSRSENLKAPGSLIGSYKRTMTHCKSGHEFTAENTRWYRQHRICRTCARLNEAAKRKKKKELKRATN